MFEGAEAKLVCMICSTSSRSLGSTQDTGCKALGGHLPCRQCAVLRRVPVTHAPRLTGHLYLNDRPLPSTSPQLQHAQTPCTTAFRRLSRDPDACGKVMPDTIIT